MKKLIVFSLVLAIMISLVGIPVEAKSANAKGAVELGIVTFPDANLEAAIRGAINKPQGPIYKSDLESLTTLVALGGYLGPRQSGILPKPADAFPLSKQHQRHLTTG